MDLLHSNPKPLSVRNLFYQMVAQHGYPKEGAEGLGFYKAVSRDLTDMR